MTLEKAHTRGPLNDIQKTLLKMVIEGKTYQEIGDVVGHTKSYVTNILSQIVYPKLGVKKATEAAALYSRYEAYLEVAERLRGGKFDQPMDGSEAEVNLILEGLANLYQRTARELLP